MKAEALCIAGGVLQHWFFSSRLFFSAQKIDVGWLEPRSYQPAIQLMLLQPNYVVFPHDGFLKPGLYHHQSTYIYSKLGFFERPFKAGGTLLYVSLPALAIIFYEDSISRITKECWLALWKLISYWVVEQCLTATDTLEWILLLQFPISVEFILFFYLSNTVLM